MSWNRGQFAVDAVAKHYSATADGSSLTIAGKRVLLDAVTIKSRKAVPSADATPRLRFDKVALEFVDRLRSALHAEVPHGQTLVLTVTAPIRQSGKTAKDFEERIRQGLARRSARLGIRDTIEGNEVRATLVKAPCPAKVIGFVHNPNIDGTVLLDATEAFFSSLEASERRRARTKSRSDRWLVVVGGEGLVETYRHVCATCSPKTGYKRILMMPAGDRVERLVG